MVHQVPQLLDFFRSVFPTQGQHGGENRFGREVFADEGTVLNQLLLTVELDPYRELGALAQENRHRLGADNQQVFCEFASERAQMGGVANSVGSQEPCPVSDGIRGVTASTRIVKLDEAWAEHLRRFPAPEPSTAGASPSAGLGTSGSTTWGPLMMAYLRARRLRASREVTQAKERRKVGTGSATS